MRIALLLCSALILGGCDDGTDGGGEDGAGGAAPATDLTVVAYNIGMARGYVDHAAERFDHILAALNDLEGADVVCLQEVWDDADVTALIEATRSTYPESHMHRSRLTDFPVEEGMAPPCTEEETASLVACSVPLCDGEADLATCVLENCGEQFGDLSEECQGCAAQNLSLGNVPAIVEACTTTGGDRYSYDGHNGLLLLSKTPISDADFVVMPSFLTVRGILYGVVNGVGIVCTHLTATLEEPAYSGEYDSYDAENAAHVEQVIAYMNGKHVDTPAIIAGDFNNGPAAGDGITADLPDNYQLFIADGWADPNVDSDAPLCTWCDDNPLAGSGIQNAMLDHIMVKNATVSSFERIYDGRIDIEKDDGMTLNVCLSDHYGLRATLDWE
jgi:endonuclease/exonuclease/phosphatase family metal-dependent hydrolase